MPAQLAGVRIERNYRTGVKIGTRPLLSVVIRTDISYSPVGQVQCGIEGSGDPNGASPMLPGLRIAVSGARLAVLPRFVSWLTRTRDRVKFPHLLSSAGV